MVRDKLYESKKNGGLGMRNLSIFNKAFLSKQAWIKFPDSLMAKTLKNKYFPHSSFMEVKVSPIASYTWRSILSARDFLQKGFKKVVEEGTTMSIWENPWVPTLPSFRVLPRGETLEDKPHAVSDLMLNKVWNVELLNQLFSRWEVEAITSIPISQSKCEDKWA